MAIVNKFNVNKQQVTLDADIIENMSANDVSYNSSLQYDENTVGDKLSELESQAIYDVSDHNNGAVFESLQDLLSSSNLDTLIPTSVRHGGMSIRFVQSSDNKYVQYHYMSDDITESSFTNIFNWQDNDPKTIISDINRGIVKDGWDILASNQIIRENIKDLISFIFKVEKGDILGVSCKQYTDTSMLAFSSSMPKVGDQVTIIEVGGSSNGSAIKTISHIFTTDGYCIISCLKNSMEYTDFRLSTGAIALYTEILLENTLNNQIRNEFENNKEIVDNEISDITYNIRQIQKSIDIKDYKFNKIPQTYLAYKDGVVSIAPLSGEIYTTSPIRVNRGTNIEIVCEFKWGDMATIAICDEKGNNLGLLRLASKFTEDLSEGDVSKYKTLYTCIEDGYVILSSTSIDGYGITIWDEAFDQDVRQVNFIPNVCFESISVESAGEKASWTANQIIENIYEPLRLAHPEYITRRSLGKDASNTYDIWLYEFNNNIDEWFSLQNTVDVFGTNLVNVDGLSSNQFRVNKSWFDTYFATKNYKNLYVESQFAVRKPTLCETPIEETIDGTVYYKFTCTDNVKEVIKNDQHGVTLYWTDEIKTYDQHCLFISGVHGDETAGYLSLALSLQYFIEHHSANKTLDYIFNHVKLSVIPCLNIWGSNQSPKVRNNALDVQLNQYNNNPLAAEQQILVNYINSVKDELSVFIDFHTSELWSNYGFVYAIGTANSKLFPSLTTAANYLCKHWFPSMPPFNWNIGVLNYNTATKYAKEHYNVESATVEFCGQDLMAFGNCERWSAKYMTYAVENYINFMISLCSLRYRDNSQNIIYSKLSNHQTMA